MFCVFDQINATFGKHKTPLWKTLYCSVRGAKRVISSKYYKITLSFTCPQVF